MSFVWKNSIFMALEDSVYLKYPKHICFPVYLSVAPRLNLGFSSIYFFMPPFILMYFLPIYIY